MDNIQSSYGKAKTIPKSSFSRAPLASESSAYHALVLSCGNPIAKKRPIDPTRGLLYCYIVLVLQIEISE